jgi:hypothetical protein
MLDVPCDTIATLVTQTPDLELSGCLDACEVNNTCTLCTESRCASQLNACHQDTTCTNYLDCIDSCLDANCLDSCHENFRSDPITYLGMCMWDECQIACTDLFAYPQ